QPKIERFAPPPFGSVPRTALVVEPRNGALWVFVPPLASFDDFCALVGAIDRARVATGLDCAIEGYAPPPHPQVLKFAVTPDPGVLEVNLPPVASSRAAAKLHDEVYQCALATGLTSEKYLLDGRAAGSGGGHHITLGGATAERSPWFAKPELIASLVTFAQHHPALSYMFTGLFVGPTSQAPRLDEARHDALTELELALPQLHNQPPAWQVDALLRHLLVDVAGSTHRAEISIDKLYDPGTPFGRQGLVELRAFEMPPHPRMAAAQVVLARSLVAAFSREPYRHSLVRWGEQLHDRFLLPYFMWRDFEDVLAHLERVGVPLPREAFTPFIDLRCPLVGTLQLGDARLELRNAIEPWHVLGEEASQAGTSRYVDSSLERIELRTIGLDLERYAIVCGGAVLPLRAVAGRDIHAGGVKFRAWAPPHALHPHFGIHHPLHIAVVDTWNKRAVGAATYHVWHPEGRAFEAPPLTRVEAAARRAQRFTVGNPPAWPVHAKKLASDRYTLDLRTFSAGTPMPRAEDWITE
ncbi:MAG TPA: transglutaminase family protein, partial [Kofleriaceae bacterium]